MIQSIIDFPKLFEKGKLKQIKVPKNYRNIKNIIVAGMGASAIPAEVLKEAIDLDIPFEISKKYILPSYANENTLLICLSRSGKTRETLNQFEQGKKRRCKIISISCGEELEEKSKENNNLYLKLPPDFLKKQTRETFPFLIAFLINIFKEMGFIKKFPSIDVIKKEKEIIRKEAKIFTKKIEKGFPLICCQYSSVSFRWESQLSENSKKLSESLSLPELVHNEAEAWQKITKNYSIIILRDNKERKELSAQIEGFKKLTKNKTKIFELRARGKERLERMLFLILFGDFVSYFLSQKRKVNPNVNNYISKIKEEVRKNS
jgi:glucose/mannose-6-phosphate isomerase